MEQLNAVLLTIFLLLGIVWMIYLVMTEISMERRSRLANIRFEVHMREIEKALIESIKGKEKTAKPKVNKAKWKLEEVPVTKIRVKK